MRSLEVLALGFIIAAAPVVQAQSKPSSATPGKPGATTAGKSAPAAAKPASAAPAGKPQAVKPQTAKPPAGKPASKVAAKSAPKRKVEQAASTEPAAEGDQTGKAGVRRDPFESLVSRQQAQQRVNANLPPGKAGLQVSTLRLDGIVKSANGMIAVVTNPQARTYFLREGDQLYDGRVEKIAMDGVSFHEIGKDAFGKPVERQVNKRIYSSTPGEQQ
ncbi:MAG TPA: pilus assembly protein PilP [Candidatus Dormibacteraeota bacterium]|nr:pilus assembly protein PilP [Candidatus Dormibacteraeota bacterium]